MAVTINASTSSGLVQSADNSGIIQFQSNGSTKATLSSSGFSYPGAVLQVQSVYLTSATQLTSGGALHELSTSLRIAFTPVSSSSTLYLECFGCFFFPGSPNLQYAYFYDVTNSTPVNLPPASGSRTSVHWVNRTTPYDPNDADKMQFFISVASANTTPRTYTIYHGTEGATAQFLVSTLSTGAGTTMPIIFKITEVAA
jgi:hypothetical protein